MICFFFIFSLSDVVHVDNIMKFEKYKLDSDGQLEIKGDFEHLLVVFRNFSNIEVSAHYSNSANGEDGLTNILDIQHFPFAYLPKFGSVKIRAVAFDKGLVSFTAICLPDECSTRLWISNEPASNLRITGSKKWPYRLTKEPMCAVFAYAPLITYSYQINLKPHEKVRFIGSKETHIAKGDKTDSVDVENATVVFKGLSAGRGKYIRISTSTRVSLKPTTPYSDFVMVGYKFYSSFWFNAIYFPYFCFIVILIIIIYYLNKSFSKRNIKDDPQDIGYLKL